MKKRNELHVNRKISIYKNFSTVNQFNPKPFYKKSHSLNIRQIFEVIKNGGGIHDIQDFKNSIEYIQTHSKSEYQYVKLNLPSFTASADFEDKKDKKSKKEYTQIIGFDFDKLEPEDVNEKFELLKDYSGTLLIFKSPSGLGIKLFFQVEDVSEKNHDLFYKCMAESLRSLFGVNADMQCIDYTRLCFFSFDTNAYFNEFADVVPANEVIKKYQHLIPKSSENSEVDSFNYGGVNTDNIKSVFDSFINQLQAGGVDWIDGSRNKFLLEICKIKKFGITLEECVTAVLDYIDGRYTREYDSSSIPDIIAYNWKNYFKINVSSNQPIHSLQINNYLTEQKDFIKSELLSKRILYINSPTGSGKTTLVKALAKELNLKTDIIMPTTALVEQQEDIKGITGRKGLNSELVNADILACCYNSINKIQDRESKLLIIDEAHSLVSDYSYKSKVIQDIQRNRDNYEYVIYLSGSLFPLDGYYSNDNLLSFEKKNRFNYQYELISLDKGITNKDYFINSLVTGNLNVFYKNDKSELDKLYQYLTEKGLKVAYVSSDKKDNLEYKGIVENSSLKGYDILLSTCVIQAGVNINECDKDIIITFGSGSTLIDYIQFTARFRKQVPQVRIIHSDKLGQLYIADNEELLARAESEKKLLEKAREKNQNRSFGFNSFNADEIIKGYDFVFLNNDGEYQIDTFCMLHNNYLTLNQNVTSNVRVLKHYLNQFNFTEIESGTVCINEESVKEIKQQGRNYNKEKKEKINTVIESIFNGSYVFNDSNDKISKDIEKKYIFLSSYLSDKVIKGEQLLTSKAKYNLFRSRIIYTIADAEIKAGNAVNDKVLLQYQSLKKLERELQINTTYTSKELKDIILNCKFDATSNDYINKSVGVLYEFERAKDRSHYSIKKRVYPPFKTYNISGDLDTLF